MGWNILLSLLLLVQDTTYDFFDDAIGLRSASGLEPEVGREVVVSAGDAVIKTDNYRYSQGVSLDADVQSPVKFSKKIDIQRGTQLYRVKSSKPFKACWIGHYITPGLWPCLFDLDGDGDFDSMARDPFAGPQMLPAQISYTKIDVRLPPIEAGFTRAILYHGAAQGSLHLSYREFSDNLARQPFTEDITIPLGQTFPQQFAVKGLVFTAFEISPLGLRYRLDAIRPGNGWPVEP